METMGYLFSPSEHLEILYCGAAAWDWLSGKWECGRGNKQKHRTNRMNTRICLWLPMDMCVLLTEGIHPQMREEQRERMNGMGLRGKGGARSALPTIEDKY